LTRDQVAAMLLDSGNFYLNKNNHAEAIRYYDSLINHYGGTFQYRVAFYFRGKAKMAQNRDVPSMVDFNMFNTLDKCQSSFCTDAHYNLAVLKFRNDRLDECLQELNWVLKDSTYKNYRYAFFYRGFCRAAAEEYIPAIQDLTRFIDMDGGKTYSSAEALYYRGYYKAQMSDNRGAIRDYDEAIKLYEAGLNAKANPAYQQKLIDTYIVRALAKANVKKYDEAIADYDVVIRLNPKYATAYRLKGLAEVGKGDKDNGCLDLSRAGELGSNEAYDDIKLHCR
jgi:tetratricopeptide (TPR) repeat protein